ncbi:MAG: fibronectin type III domain-containing protein [Thermonemataceae bacterium]
MGGVNVSNITRSGATVSWNPLSSNSGAVGYTILLNGNSIGSSSTTDTFFNITGLSVNTDYSVSIVAFDGIGNQMASSTEVSFTTLNSVGVPTAICTNVDGIAERPLPYTEGFESGVDWKQSNNDDGDWKLATSFSTPSAAAEGKRYLILRYIENNGTAIIRTPCIDLTDKSDASFTFQYQLYGNDIGNLVLQVDDGTGWVDYWSQSGDQGNI